MNAIDSDNPLIRLIPYLGISLGFVPLFISENYVDYKKLDRKISQKY